MGLLLRRIYLMSHKSITRLKRIRSSFINGLTVTRMTFFSGLWSPWFHHIFFFCFFPNLNTKYLRRQMFHNPWGLVGSDSTVIRKKKKKAATLYIMSSQNKRCCRLIDLLPLLTQLKCQRCQSGLTCHRRICVHESWTLGHTGVQYLLQEVQRPRRSHCIKSPPNHFIYIFPEWTCGGPSHQLLEPQVLIGSYRPSSLHLKMLQLVHPRNKIPL